MAEHFSAVDAAAAAGVRRIVYVSFMGAAPDCVFTFARDQAATEEQIRSAGLGHDPALVHVRRVRARVRLARGRIRGPAGEGGPRSPRATTSPTSRPRCSATPSPRGRTYDVTGPAALTLDEAAAIVSEAAGRQVVYERETLEQARRSAPPSGAPDWEIEGWVTSYAAIADGSSRPSATPSSGSPATPRGRWPTSCASTLEHLAHLQR